ncbi:aminodeoxychorismate synthase component I [Myxococcota bacterium]|nr:aminodeoxychorismate synthase component I [Myxococcota bacterium]
MLSSACEILEIDVSGDFLELFEPLRHGSHTWLLDSSLPSGRLGRYCFGGADPYLVLRARGRKIELDCRRGVRPDLPTGQRVVEGNPFEVLRELLPPPPSGITATPPFIGGVVGYLGYELVQHLEPFESSAIDDLALPDMVLLFVDRVLIFDHQTGKAMACGLGFSQNPKTARKHALDAARELEVQLRNDGDTRAVEASLRPLPPVSTPADFDVADYRKAVDAALEEIAAGNVYQACLTRRFERACPADAFDLYRAVRRRNPAPFGSFFDLPEAAIVGSSPERFLRLDTQRNVESRPIKGTRHRHHDPEEDAASRRVLEESAKDQAENLMIVDLVRNDLGRVCETGSVSVPELMCIEDYASVFQMVSTVTGTLRSDRDVIDLVCAAFPPGSMTGAPKIAAIHLLDGLEPVRRGIYSGAIGYFDARGGADLSVVIRTILLSEGRAFVHAGGGIVADSRPDSELREVLDKAGPLFAALDEVGGR